MAVLRADRAMWMGRALTGALGWPARLALAGLLGATAGCPHRGTEQGDGDGGVDGGGRADAGESIPDANTLPVPDAWWGVPDATPWWIPDAGPVPDAMPDVGDLHMTWLFRVEGTSMPARSCADMGVNDVEIHVRDAATGTSAADLSEPCDTSLVGVTLPSGDYVVEITFGHVDAAGIFSSKARMFSDVVTITPGSTVFLPIVFRMFDEPVAQMQAIFDAAAAHYAASPDPKVFPASVGPTPAETACCTYLPEFICPPDATLWGSSWSDLGFSVDGLSRYSYTFSSSGSGAGATFQIRASANYDCDANSRRYTINGSLAADGSIAGRDVVFFDDTD